MRRDGHARYQAEEWLVQETRSEELGQRKTISTSLEVAAKTERNAMDTFNDDYQRARR